MDSADCGDQGFRKVGCLSLELQNDDSLLVRNGCIVATGLEEGIRKIFGFRVKTRGDDSEIKALHRPPSVCLQRPTARRMSFACDSRFRGVDHTKIVHPSRSLWGQSNFPQA